MGAAVNPPAPAPAQQTADASRKRPADTESSTPEKRARTTDAMIKNAICIATGFDTLFEDLQTLVGTNTRIEAANKELREKNVNLAEISLKVTREARQTTSFLQGTLERVQGEADGAKREVASLQSAIMAANRREKAVLQRVCSLQQRLDNQAAEVASSSHQPPTEGCMVRLAQAREDLNRSADAMRQSNP